jgi:ribosomal protein S13
MNEKEIWDERKRLFMEVRKMVNALREEELGKISQLVKSLELSCEYETADKIKEELNRKTDEIINLWMSLESLNLLREIRAIELEQLRLLKEICELLHEKKKL